MERLKFMEEHNFSLEVRKETVKDFDIGRKCKVFQGPLTMNMELIFDRHPEFY